MVIVSLYSPKAIEEYPFLTEDTHMASYINAVVGQS